MISQGGAPRPGSVLIDEQGCHGCAPIFVALRDVGARITPGPGCASVDPNTVRCAFMGDNNAIELFGGDGVDFLDARPLAGSPVWGPTLSGGPGNDLLVAGRKLRSDLRGDSGDDKLIGAEMQDLLVGGPGNDRLEGGFGEDQLFGSDGSDTLLGAMANDELKGGKGDDRIVGAALSGAR